MNTIARLISRLSTCIALLAALDAAAFPTMYNWTGFAKDSGMAQYRSMAGTTSGGKYMLYVGSENFSSSGAGKLDVYQQAASGGFAIPIMSVSFHTFEGDASIEALFVLPLGFMAAAVPYVTVVTDTAHVYLFDGTNWTNITPTAAAFSSNLGVYSVAPYGQKLFVGTGGSAGSAQVWAYDGANWTQQSLPGFPNDNYYAWTMTVFNNALYVGTVDYSRAAQVWKYDGNSWSQVSIPGFSSANYAIASMTVYNGKLYLGTSNTQGGGAQLWSYDGSAWSQLAGFGKNDAATAMAVLDGVLYIGTTNYTQNAVGQLWAFDGTTLAQVTAPGTFGSAGNTGIVSLMAADGGLIVGTYNNSGAELWAVTASGSSTSANLPGALSGLWWNQNESGWGIDFTQRGANIFAAWYTYDASGKPKWYVASSCAGAAATSGTCNGTLYSVSGPTFFGGSFNTQLVNAVPAGNLSVTFQDANNGSMTYTLGSQTRTVAITRQPVGAGAAVSSVDYTDLWWNANESGWGMAMAQQLGNIFLAWFVYDASGQPTWYVASNCAMTASGCSGTVYATTGPPFGPTFDTTQVHATAVGTVTVTFTDANNATLTYTVNGTSGTKQVTRQLF